METSNSFLRIGIITVIVISALGIGWWYYGTEANPFPLQAGDTVQSWDFQGSHKDGGANEQKARDEIVRLQTMLDDEEQEPTDYVLYVGIANQYSLLGDGKSTYKYLGKALKIDSEKTGLAWHNMGSLLDRLGALNSARVAFGNAVKAQPHVEQYHISYIDFLMRHYSEDKALMESAFKVARDEFGEGSSTIFQEMSWLLEQDRHADAITLLKKARDVVPEELRPSIDAEITRLEVRQ